MSEFEVLIPLFLFTFIFIIIMKLMKNRHERKKWELMRHEGAAENSLTTSELQLMIEDAVAKETAELEERLERLERLQRPQLEASEIHKTAGRIS